MSPSPLRNVRKGQEVRVTFLDHVEDSDDAIECVVRGLVVRNNRYQCTIECWTCTDPDVNAYGTNSKRFTIVKSTIRRVVVLEPKKG